MSRHWRARRPAAQGIALPLLSLMVFINYVDRGNLATAAPLIAPDLKLSASQLGLIISAFYWSYTPGHLLCGWLSGKWGAQRTLAAAAALWSLTTAASALATGFATLLAARLLLGLGESAAFPCGSRIIAEQVPQHRMGMANGLLVLGTALGPAFGVLAGGLIMAHAGWRSTFLVLGGVSLLWLLPWLFVVPRSQHPPPDVSSAADGTGLLQVFRQRQMWAVSMGHFATNYAFYVVISWLPAYLVKVQGLTLAQMATTGAVIYLTYAASSLGLSWLSDRLIVRGVSADLVRRAWAGGGLVLVSLSLTACATLPTAWATVALCSAAVGFGATAPNLYSIAQVLAGPQRSGVWIGAQNMLANVAGMVAPFVMGVLLDRTGGFAAGFWVCAAAAACGAIALTAGLGRVTPIGWNAPPRLPEPAA